MDSVQSLLEVSKDFTDLPPTFPSRTSTYHISPIGLSTARVESLSSYILRLAARMHTPLPKFIKWLLQESIGHEHQPPKSQWRAFASQTLGAANDPQIFYSWVTTLEKVTEGTNYHLATIQPIWHLFTHRHLLKRERQWCPVCLQAQIELDIQPHELLVWSIAAYTYCPLHRQALQAICPKCAFICHINQGIAKPMHPGYCFRCQCWLGTTLSPLVVSSSHETTQHENARIETEIQNALTIEEVFQLSVQQEQPPDAQLWRNNLHRSIAWFTGGKNLYFMKHIIASRNPSYNTRRDGISLPTALIVSFLIGIPIVKLMSDSCLSFPGYRTSCVAIKPINRAYPSQHLTQEQWIYIEQILYKVMEHFDGVPGILHEVAQRLNVAERRIVKKFPHFRARLGIQVHRSTVPQEDLATMRKTLENALQDELCPSLTLLASSIGHTTHFVKTHFADIYSKILLLHEKKYEQAEVKAILDEACASQVPPFLRVSELAARVNYTYAALYARFPAECRFISQKHKQYSIQLGKENL